jgi:NTE family protein
MTRIGLVFGAGGVVGEAFHHGVLQAMDDLGIAASGADLVVGTSAGSIVAASVRRRSAAGPVRPLTMRGDGLRRRHDALALLRRPRQMINGLLLTPEALHGRIPTDFLTDGLRAKHGDRWPEAALWVVAVRRRDGQRVVFGRDGDPPADVASAVAASCAIPAYFAPVNIGGVSYVDGGVHSPTNADLLAPWDLDLVVISSPMSMEPRAALRPRLDTGFRLLFHRYLAEEAWVLRQHDTRVIRIEPDAGVLSTMGLNMLNGKRIDEVTEAAHRLALRRLSAVVPA